MAPKTQQKIQELASVEIPRLLWRFFVPAFSGVILSSLYNIVDRIFIGQGVGAEALSGLSSVFPMMIVVMAFGMLVGMGAGVRISIAMGQRDVPRAENILGNAFVLMILISLGITLVGWWLKEPMLRMFGVQDSTYRYASDYFEIILMGTVFQVVGFSMNSLIRSEGSPRISMISMFISAGVNLILDPVFIFGLGMGVKGAAYATVISQVLLCVWVVGHFRSKRSVLRLRRIHLRIDKTIAWSILSIGFAPFSMQLASSLVQGSYNAQLMRFGNDYAIGAMGIVNSVAILLVMSVIALNMASQPIVGFNYGAKNYHRVLQTLSISLVAATVICIVGWMVVELFPEAILSLFNRDNEALRTIGVQGLRVALMALPIVGFQVVAGNFFQSIGKARVAAFLSLMRQVIVLLPLLWILPAYWGIDGVWYSGPIADCISATVCALFLVAEMRRLKGLHRNAHNGLNFLEPETLNEEKK